MPFKSRDEILNFCIIGNFLKVVTFIENLFWRFILSKSCFVVLLFWSLSACYLVGNTLFGKYTQVATKYYTFKTTTTSQLFDLFSVCLSIIVGLSFFLILDNFRIYNLDWNVHFIHILKPVNRKCWQLFIYFNDTYEQRFCEEKIWILSNEAEMHYFIPTFK